MYGILIPFVFLFTIGKGVRIFITRVQAKDLISELIMDTSTAFIINPVLYIQCCFPITGIRLLLGPPALIFCGSGCTARASGHRWDTSIIEGALYRPARHAHRPSTEAHE